MSNKDQMNPFGGGIITPSPASPTLKKARGTAPTPVKMSNEDAPSPAPAMKVANPAVVPGKLPSIRRKKRFKPNLGPINPGVGTLYPPGVKTPLPTMAYSERAAKMPSAIQAFKVVLPGVVEPKKRG
jgi:hypothetical protein